MEKIIKRFGNSIGISFGKDEKEIYKLAVGKVIEVKILNTRNKSDDAHKNGKTRQQIESSSGNEGL